MVYKNDKKRGILDKSGYSLNNYIPFFVSLRYISYVSII